MTVDPSERQGWDDSEGVVVIRARPVAGPPADEAPASAGSAVTGPTDAPESSVTATDVTSQESQPSNAPHGSPPPTPVGDEVTQVPTRSRRLRPRKADAVAAASRTAELAGVGAAPDDTTSTARSQRETVSVPPVSSEVPGTASVKVPRADSAPEVLTLPPSEPAAGKEAASASPAKEPITVVIRPDAHVSGGQTTAGADGSAVIDLTHTQPIPAVGSRAATPWNPDRTLVGMEARSVSAWFGDHMVLEGVSLGIEPGEVTALIGPSGCGKSTFLRILNRMHEMVRGAALAGEVLLDDRDIYESGRRPSDVRRRVGMVFQRPNPFPAMSIYDNVVSGLKLAGIHCDDKDSLVEQSLTRASLWTEVRNRLQSPGGALSGGQQQRLCIARSLAVAPDVLLMDEPCSALDPTSTRRVEDTIAELRGEVTIVIVTHNMQQAARVSDSCAFFLATHDTPGHIVEAGPTARLFSDPVDTRTADYVNGRFG